MKIRELFQGRVFTISNMLSLARIILVPFIAYSLTLERDTGDTIYRNYALLLLFILIATDFFDGFLARALNQVSRLGQFLDPIADKIAALSLGIVLYIYRGFPLWLVLITMFRDIYSVTGGLVLLYRKDVQVRPNIAGKIMVAVMALSAFIFILNPKTLFFDISVQDWSIIVILFFIFVSSIMYWRTYSKVYFNGEIK